MVYVCVNKCFHRGRLWKRGDEYVPAKDEKVPHHFIEMSAGEKPPEEPTPRLGTKVAKRKEFPSMKAPGKEAFKKGE